MQGRAQRRTPQAAPPVCADHRGLDGARRYTREQQRLPKVSPQSRVVGESGGETVDRIDPWCAMPPKKNPAASKAVDPEKLTVP